MSVTKANVIKIWKDVVTSDQLTEADWNSITNEAVQETKGIKYGNWCGPGTKNNKQTVTTDGLDLMCKLHDTVYVDCSQKLYRPFASNFKADLALIKGADLIRKNNLLKSKKSNKVGKVVSNPLFCCVSQVWSLRWPLTSWILLFLIFVITSKFI